MCRDSRGPRHLSAVLLTCHCSQCRWCEPGRLRDGDHGHQHLQSEGDGPGLPGWRQGKLRQGHRCRGAIGARHGDILGPGWQGQISLALPLVFSGTSDNASFAVNASCSWIERIGGPCSPRSQKFITADPRQPEPGARDPQMPGGLVDWRAGSHSGVARNGNYRQSGSRDSPSVGGLD